MGVRGLQRFIERCCPPECCYEADLKELVETFKKETDGKKPIIVFDGDCCVRLIYNNFSHWDVYKGLDWITGGQYKEFLEKLCEFVQAFKNIGVHLVFFFGGGTIKPKREEAIKRCHERQQRIYETFDLLKNGMPTHRVPFKYSLAPSGVGVFSRHYLEHILDCEVFQSVDETDTEIAHYARKNQCLGIFGQDSDFLIYEGGKYYLSGAHFDIRRMKTKVYDRRHLASHLNLYESQLPLLATLAGNDLVNCDDLEDFHKFVCQNFGSRSRITSNNWHVKRNKKLYPALAEYVCEFSLGEAVIPELPCIAQTAFGDYTKATILETSIRSYLPSTEIQERSSLRNHPEWNAILERAEELHRKNQLASTVFHIMDGGAFETGAAFEDYRSQDLLPFARMLGPLRQRIYGILLKEKPSSGGYTVEEWCMEGGDSINEPSYVKPLPPTDHHPGLLTLWSQDRSEELQNDRWKLFAHAISQRLNHDVLKNLPDHLVLPTAVMVYLVDTMLDQRKGLEAWEIEALIATIVILPSVPIHRLASLPSDPVDIRAARISTIFMRSLWTVVILLSSCGYPLSPDKAFIHPYFDGKLFRQKYIEALNAEEELSHSTLCEDEGSNLKQFQDIRQIVFQT